MARFTIDSARRIAAVVRRVERSGGGEVLRRGKFDDVRSRIDAYFWIRQTGPDSVRVLAGATQSAGSDPIARAGAEFDDLEDDTVIYVRYLLRDREWDTGSGFLHSGPDLPESDEDNDYRPIGKIEVEGAGTEHDPYRIGAIRQAHVGILREPQFPPIAFPTLTEGQKATLLLDHEGAWSWAIYESDFECETPE